MTYTRYRSQSRFRGRQQSTPQRNGGFSRARRSGAGQTNINIAQLIKKADVLTPVAAYTPKYSFADFQIHATLKQNILNKGYTSPTPIQDQTIPYLLEGNDVVGIANTGTGKTAAFLIPLINKIAHNPEAKALIVAPTRELAFQIQEECRAFTQSMHIYSLLCIGGVSMYHQITSLQRNPSIVIATPGRLKDLSNKNKIKLASYTTIVLDEVDRMLDMGFIHDVRFIISKLPHNRQSLFFSATISPSMHELMQTFLKTPKTISVKTAATAQNVDQDIVKMQGRQKIDVLHGLLNQAGFEKVIVFGRTKWGIEKLAKALDSRGLRVAAIHGNKNQNQRLRALQEFKTNRVQALLATDVASRGLDIDNVTHVINYDMPESYDDYVHRIGRTGRAEKKGTALTFVD